VTLVAGVELSTQSCKIVVDLEMSAVVGWAVRRTWTAPRSTWRWGRSALLDANADVGGLDDVAATSIPG
jgi:hypothetical protein